MDGSMHDMFYQNALLGLMNGCLMPWDKNVLSNTPLPSSVVEPYMTKEVPDIRESMRLTYETMVVWIDEARKVNYFSKRFVQLSKMIMNGVTTMGRGLITLHARGEALEGVPMSIEDLIGVASYHFRKSHLGVLQTVRSHPEVSERLLMNQISWNNMLMRLFKTREKLSQKSEIRNKKSEISGQCSVVSGIEDGGSSNSVSLSFGEKNPMLTDGMDARFDPFKVFGPADRGFSETAAISEPGAFTAPRAFSSYENQKPDENKKAEIRNKKTPCVNEEKTSENEGGRCKKKEINRALENRAEIIKTKKERQNEEKQQIKEKEVENKEKQQNEVIDREPENEKNQKENRSGRDNQTEHDLPAETQISHPPENEIGDSLSMENSPAGKPPSPEEDSGTNPEIQFPDPDMPGYLQILQNVYARSGESENSELTFTFDEIIYLAGDPGFNHFYPNQAAQMRTILQQMNDS